MKTILVPTDFSDNAARAIEYAAKLANATGTSLILLNLIKEVQKYDESISKLGAICDAIKETFNVPCSYRILLGSPLTDGIVKTAKEEGVQMIVMGTEGSGNLEKLIVGSNTATVIEKAHCPVISVPHNSTSLVPTKILFATNFEDGDVKLAIETVDLAKAFQASVVLAHVLTDPSLEDLENVRLQYFAREVKLMSDYTKISYKLLTENTVSMGLDTLIHDTNADLIALATHKRNVLEKMFDPSLTQKFSQRASIPLLAYHAN